MLDPNNHVPEVSPDDAWGDEEVPVLDPANPGGVLPPRRAVTRIEPVGLRIDSLPLPQIPADEVTRLEVQEIGGVLRLDPEKAAASKIVRQAAVKVEGVVPKEEQVQRTEDMSWGAAHPQSFRWLVVSGLGVLVLVVVALISLPFINKRGAVKPLVGQVMPVFEEAVDAEDVREIDLLFSGKGEADRIFETYATATDVAQVIPLVRDGDLLAETIRRKWKPLSAPAGWKVPVDTMWAGFAGEGPRYQMMAGNLPDHTVFTAFFTSQNDRVVLDWKATSGFGSATFEELEKGRGDGGEIRGRLELADFYTFAYPESDFQSFQLGSPDRTTSIWCYARRGGLADEATGPLLRAGEIVGEAEKEVRVTVSLQRVGTEALPNQWLLAELLHNDWVAP